MALYERYLLVRSARQTGRYAVIGSTSLTPAHFERNWTRGLVPTCSYRKPSDGRSSLRTYRPCGGFERDGLPLTTTRSPDFSVSFVIPTSTSSDRLSNSSFQRSPLASTRTNGCGLTKWNSATI